MIRLSKVKIMNYKSIKGAVLCFGEKTILIGKNNSGKSSVLEAIKLGMSYESIDSGYVYQTNESPFTYDKKVVIEMMFSPINQNGEIIDEFDDEWLLAFGDRITIAEQQSFSFQTTLEYSKERQGYINTKKLIKVWSDDVNIESETDKKISREDLENIFLLYIDAQRDLSKDIYDKHSRWYKITSNIKFSEEDTADILEKIDSINSKVIASNSILADISNNLKNSTSDKESEITISPITRDLGHLNKGMNIYYNNESVKNIPVEQLGLGVRSWGVFSVLKAYLMAEQKRREENESVFHSILLVEEPEAHLHPQAQRHLLEQIMSSIGQKIIVTHSPYIISKINIDQIILAKKDDTDTILTPLITENLNKDDLRNIKNKIMNNQGEMLYANSVILCEGETESIILPILFQKFFGKHPFELGITIIPANGSGIFKYFVKLLDILEIKWFLFSDGEKNVVENLENALKSCGYEDDIFSMENIFIIPNERCIEYYLLESGYKEEVEKAIKFHENDNNYIDNQKIVLNGQTRKEKYAKMINKDDYSNYKIRNYGIEGGDIHLLFDIMVNGKTEYIEDIANEIYNSEKEIPALISDLFTKIKEDMVNQ